MGFNVVGTFFIGIGIYLVGLLVFTLIKRYRTKKRMAKEKKEFDDENHE